MNKGMAFLALLVISVASIDVYHSIRDWCVMNTEEIEAIKYALTSPEPVFDYEGEENDSEHCSDGCYW